MSDIQPDADPPADPDELAVLQQLEGIFEERLAESDTPAETEPEQTPEETPDEIVPEGEPEGEEGELGDSGALPITLTEEEIAQLAGLKKALEDDANLARHIAAYYQPAQAAPAPQETPTPSVENLDLDDPAIAALYQLHQQQAAELAQIRQQTQGLTSGYEAQQRSQSESMYKRAAESFRVEHNLDQAALDELSNVAARLNVLPALMAGIDPMTGLPTQTDPLTAVDRALDIAYHSLPKYREHEARQLAEKRYADQKRKQNLAAVAGNSGSSPRQPAAVATDPSDRRAQMISEVAESMFGQSQS